MPVPYVIMCAIPQMIYGTAMSGSNKLKKADMRGMSALFYR